MLFTRHNENPKGHKVGDCVVRAIAKATSQTWEDVHTDLCRLSFKMKAMPNDHKVWQKYLESIEWTKNKMPRHADNTRYTVAQFLHERPQGTFIISVANHLTVAIDGELFDTWNCGYKCVGNYWTAD